MQTKSNVGNGTDDNKTANASVPVNGGLPKFVQERISGRQKKVCCLFDLHLCFIN